MPLELGLDDRGEKSELSLLLEDLLFVASHQADPLTVSATDLHLLDGLGRELSKVYLDPESRSLDELDPGSDLFARMLSDSSARELLDTWRAEAPQPVPEWHITPLAADSVYSVDIPSVEEIHRLGNLRRVLREKTNNPYAIAIGVQTHSDGAFRIFLVRREDVVVDRPSLLRLLLDLGPAYGLTREGWLPADENTLTYVSHLAKGSQASNQEQMQESTQSWALAASKARKGDTQPPAALAKVLCEAGNAALEQLDLCRRYFPKLLRFRESDTIVRYDAGNRSPHSQLRRTLILTLEVGSARAATFLLRGDGYVLSRLETKLEGVRLALERARSRWLWSVRLAHRIRINVEFTFDLSASTFDEDLARDVESIEIEGIDQTSVIGRALSEARATRSVIFREAEMIGPSVQYGRLAGVLADILGKHLPSGQSLQVLDLFSGSGYSAWNVKRECPQATVICVDAAVSIDDSLVASRQDVFWLRAPVEEVVGGGRRAGIISRHFDVVFLDPPHAALLGLMFGALLQRLSTLATWIVVYHGHTSQSGRAAAVVAALRRVSVDREIARVVVDSEEIVLCGPSRWPEDTTGLTFLDATKRIKLALEVRGHSVRLESSAAFSSIVSRPD